MYITIRLDRVARRLRLNGSTQPLREATGAQHSDEQLTTVRISFNTIGCVWSVEGSDFVYSLKAYMSTALVNNNFFRTTETPGGRVVIVVVGTGSFLSFYFTPPPHTLPLPLLSR